MLNNISKAAETAFARMDAAFKVDSEIQIYDNLKAGDFSALSGEFGPEEVAKYIKEMEYRRLNNAK